MSPNTRRKPYKYKGTKVSKVQKTSRKEIHPVTRAFVVGAIITSRDGYASVTDLAHRLDISQTAMSALVRRVESKASNSALNIWEPSLYENEPGRGRKVLLSQEQKDTIIRITTQDREHREWEPWQVIAYRNFGSTKEK